MATKAKRKRASKLPAEVVRPPKPIAGAKDDSLKSLVLDGSKFDLKASDAVLDISLERTIEGGSTVVVPVNDDDQVLTSSDFLDADRDALLDNDILVKIDGLRFALARVENQYPLYTLTFEDYAVLLMKSALKTKKVYRDKQTRAEFIYQMVREVGGLNFYCPELKDKQPIAKAAETASETAADRKPGGFDSDIEVKGVAATATQKRVIDGCLSTAAQLGASTEVLVAVVMTITQESTAGQSGPMTGNDDVGIYQQGRNWVSVSGAKDPERATKAFLVTGPTSWKKVHGSLKKVPGGYESAIKKVQISVGGYSKWEREAKATVKAWGGGTAGSGTESSVEVTKKYAYSVGKDENFWSAGQRLAEEVGWRLFAVGNTIVYMSEEEMIRQRPAMAIMRAASAPDNPPKNIDLVEDLTWTWDRSHTVQECSLKVDTARWGAQPGQVVQVFGEGAIVDGRWIVSSVKRSLFATETEIELRRPQAKKAEPAAETSSTSVSSSATGLGGSGPVRERIIEIAKSTLTSKTGFSRYSQAGALTTELMPKTARTDCSQWTRAVYLKAGAGDPGTYTVAQMNRGKRTNDPKPGDLIISASHVELYVGDGKTIGHGSPPIDYNTVAWCKGRGMQFYTYDFLDS